MMEYKKSKKIFFYNAVFFIGLVCGLVFESCATNPYTGKSTLALVGKESINQQSFAAYNEFVTQNKNNIITGTSDARLVEQVGQRLKTAAEKWAAHSGHSEYLDGYQWEYKLVKSEEVNAWCMPGGKIVVYTGILPITKNADGLAVVLGHELAHALLNHGQQQQSASVIQSVGLAGVQIGLGLSGSSNTDLASNLYVTGSTLLGTLPFSRSHESEADKIGLQLMIIAGYKGEEAIAFWERMSKLGGGGTPEFLSTHPSDTRRISNIKNELPAAQKNADAVLK